MIITKPYGVSPTYSVVIDNVPVNYMSIDRIEVELGESTHDLAIVSMGGIPPSAITEYYGAPVYISIKFANHFFHEFCGYVDIVIPNSDTASGLHNNSPFQSAKIMCMGTSYDMRGSTSHNWEGMSLTAIASEMSASYGFSLDVPSIPAFNSSLFQSNESDWQFLVRQCKNLGYEINVHGTHMHVYDPHDAASRGTSFHQLSTLKDLQVSPIPVPGQIMHFGGNFSHNNPDGSYSITSVSVIDDSGTAYEVTTSDVYGTTDTPLYRDVRKDVVDSYGEAERRVSAVRKETYDYEIDVTVIGIAGCVPGGVVDIGSHGSQFEGLWYVREVRHTLHSDAFYTDLKLARNKTNVLTQSPVPSFQAPPDPYFANGKWRASKREVNVY